MGNLNIEGQNIQNSNYTNQNIDSQVRLQFGNNSGSNQQNQSPKMVKTSKLQGVQQNHVQSQQQLPLTNQLQQLANSQKNQNDNQPQKNQGAGIAFQNSGNVQNQKNNQNQGLYNKGQINNISAQQIQFQQQLQQNSKAQAAQNNGRVFQGVQYHNNSSQQIGIIGDQSAFNSEQFNFQNNNNIQNQKKFLNQISGKNSSKTGQSQSQNNKLSGENQNKFNQKTSLSQNQGTAHLKGFEQKEDYNKQNVSSQRQQAIMISTQNINNTNININQNKNASRNSQLRGEVIQKTAIIGKQGSFILEANSQSANNRAGSTLQGNQKQNIQQQLKQQQMTQYQLFYNNTQQNFVANKNGYQNQQNRNGSEYNSGSVQDNITNQSSVKGKTQIFANRSNSQQPTNNFAQTNKVLKQKNGKILLVQNNQQQPQLIQTNSNNQNKDIKNGNAIQKLAAIPSDGQIQNMNQNLSQQQKNYNYQYDLSCYNDATKIQNNSLIPGSSGQSSVLNAMNNINKKNGGSGSVPLKYGSTESRSDTRTQNNSQVDSAILVGYQDQAVIQASRNQVNSQNNNNQTLFTNISLRGEINSQSPDGRKDGMQSNIMIDFQNQRNQKNKKSSKSKKIQITSGKHGINNNNNLDVVQVVSSSNIIHTQNPNQQNKFSRTNIFGAKTSAGLQAQQNNNQIDLNLSHISAQDLLATGSSQSVTQQIIAQNNNQRLYTNQTEMAGQTQIIDNRLSQNTGDSSELRQYLSNLNTSQQLNNQQILRNTKSVIQIQNQRNGALAQIPELINSNQYNDSPSSEINNDRGNNMNLNGLQNQNLIQSQQSQIPQDIQTQQKLQQAQNSNGNPILNIKTVQDINIYNNSFIVNTNNAGNLQNLQALMQGQQQNQNNSSASQNIFQNQIQISNQAQSQSVLAPIGFVSGEQQALTSNRASSNKRILKLRKELSGLSSGLNQSRSASQGRAVLNQTAEDQVTQANNTFNQTVVDGNYFSQQDLRSNNPQNQNQRLQNLQNKGHLSDLDLHRQSDKIYRSKAYEAYNNANIAEQNPDGSSIVHNGNNSRNSSQQSKTAGRNVMNHILSQQNNLKNLALNPNQKRIVGNPTSVGKLFGNQGQQIINKNLNFANVISAGAQVHGQSHKQKLNNINQNIGYQTGYYVNPKTMKQEGSIKNKGLNEKSSSNTTRINSKIQSRLGQQLNAATGFFDEFGNELSQQQIMSSIGENNNQGIILTGKPSQHQIQKGLSNIKFNNQQSNTHSSNNTGSRAQSHTNHIQKVIYNGEISNASGQPGRIMVMNKNDFNATSEGDGPGQIRADLNQSNFSYITEGEIHDSQTHSKSQVVLSQLNESHKYGAIPNNINNAMIGKTNIYQQNQQKVNLNSYEIRKQSLQDLRGQNIRFVGDSNGILNHKFKNQLQQNSSDHDGRYSHNNELINLVQHPGNIINSVSIKNEQQLLSLNRGAIMNRVKTQDANSKDENNNLISKQNLMSPIRQKQEKLSQKAIKNLQDNLKPLQQASQKIINQIKSIQMPESELKQLEKQFDQIIDKFDQFLLSIRENMDQFQDIENAVIQLKNIEEQTFDQIVELQVYKILTLADQGSNHQAIQEIDKIIQSDQQLFMNLSAYKIQENMKSSASDQLLQLKIQQQLNSNEANSEQITNQLKIRLQKIEKRLQFCLLMKSILQRKIGEFEQSLNTASECIQIFPIFKDAFFVRGQVNLLQKKNQRAVQDFTEFNNIADQEQSLILQNQTSNILPQAIPNKNNQNSDAQIQKQQISDQQKQYSLQIAIGKESLGDAYKLLKKHKLANQSYEESLSKLYYIFQNTQKAQNVQKNLKNIQIQEFNFNGPQFLVQLESLIIKVKFKIAMSLYYQGKMQNSFNLLKEIKQFFSKYDFESLKVQQKLIKCNFYMGKAILASLDNELEKNSLSYQESLKCFYYCTKEEFDPEIHELYSGNSYFEISKIFLKQRDILNAYEFMQRANDNNYNSKRLSLYRDFTEGVVYLMKRKIKKGVQILTDLIEVLINGQKEIEKAKIKAKNDQIEIQANRMKNDKGNNLDRYGNQKDSDNETDILRKVALANQSDISNHNSSVDQAKSTINGKANLIASGKFDQEMYDYLIFNIHIYRAYGYVAIEKYEHALDDFRRAKKISPFAIDKATIYNKWLSRGILKMDTEEYLMASKYFSKASLIFPQNKDAFCLNVISIVRSYTFSLQDKFIDDIIKYDKVIQTREFLNVSIKCCSVQGQKQPSLYFFRGLLNFQVHDFYNALSDFNMAIKEEDEPTGQFHLARGRTYACLSILDEALKDLSIALDLDDSLLEAYIFRGKCAYLLGDNNLAFHDFQKLIISDQKNPLVHIYAGNLLMTTGAYTDAIKAFDNADTVQQTATAAFQRIRCFCALSDLEKAFEQMQLCKHQAPNEKFAQYDYKVLLSMLSCVRAFDFKKGENGQVDDAGQIEFLDIIKNCLVQISSIIQIYEKGEHLQLKKGQSPMSVQIIPNVGKIKIEKKFVMKQLVLNQGKAVELPALKASEIKSLNEADRFGYYRENIFQLEDMYLYRGIYKMYLGNYEEAQVDLNKSWNHHFQLKKQAILEQQKNQNQNKNKVGIDTEMDDEMYGKFPASQLVSPINSVHSYQSHKTDLSDIGLCSLNLREYNYNCIILSIQIKNWDMAIKKINEELSTSVQSVEQSKNIKQLYLVRAMIYQEIGQTDKYNQDLTVYLKNFQKIQKNQSGAVIIEPFDVKGRLCEQFEPIKMNFQQQKAKQKSQFTIWMRPSFSMPFIKPPNMIPNIDEEALQSEFNLKQIDAPMPEAPWNRQCRNQNFKPIKYNQNQNDQNGQKKDQKAIPLPSLPIEQGNVMFLQKYQNFQNDKQRQILFDSNVMADIDDISDTEKVSLISDIELTGEDYIDIDGKNQIITQQKKPRIHSFAADVESLNEVQGIDNGLNLKNLNDINKIGLPGGKKISNGVKISKQKYLCRHKRSCSSCYKIPLLPDFLNTANQEIYVSNLLMNRESKDELRKKILNNEEILPSTTLYVKSNLSQAKNVQKFEDTVSDEEGLSSDTSQDEKNKKESNKNSKDNNKKNKDDMKQVNSNSRSQSSHSRFSSNIGDFEIQDDVGEGIKNLNIGETDIQISEIKIQDKQKNFKDQLKNDPFIQEKQLKKTEKINNINKINNKNIVINDCQNDKNFNKNIGSIQQTEDHLNLNSPNNQNESPYLMAKTPEKLFGKLEKQDQKQSDGIQKDERDSMVIMGSMSLNKTDGTGIKKKQKRAGGIGGTNNLKKNKLAIAFNNIENTD